MCANCTLCVCTRIRYNPRLQVDMYTVRTHTHTVIYSDMYIFSYRMVHAAQHTYTYTNVQTWTCVAECGDREMVVGVGESRPTMEVDNFESSFNLSHPPERVSSLSPFPARPCVSILRPREPLFLHSNRFRCRAAIAYQSSVTFALRV